MLIDIVTLAPEMWSALDYGVVGRAKRECIWTPALWNLRDFSDRLDRRVDDKSYGGGPGMVITPEPVLGCIEHIQSIRSQRPFVIEMDPSGQPLDGLLAKCLAKKPGLLLLCGRYEGIDARIKSQCVDLSISVGPYVLSGGDLAGMCLVDSICRFLPGTLGNPISLLSESHDDGLLDYPHYTRPQAHRTGSVPEALISGDPKKIDRWRRMMALGRTWENQPELLQNMYFSEEDIDLLGAYMRGDR